MADKRTDQLDAASALAGTEPIPVYQGGTTKRTTPDAIRNRVISGLGGLTEASALDGSEIVGVAQEGNARRVTTQDIADLANAGSAVKQITIGFDAGTVDGIDQPLTTGKRFELRTVTSLDPVAWTLLPKSGSSGNITVEVRKRPFSSGTFTAITAGSPPSSTAGARATASAAAWDAVGDGDLIEFEITSVTGSVTGVTLIVEANEV